MTIYDRQEYYKEALDSLANQTKQDFELLIYTNIPVKYDLKKFRDVEIIEDVPQALGLRYGNCIRRAKNDKIAFLDDDDTFSPDKIEYLDSINFQYFHNDYNHLTEGNHNPGKGFNMSCIAIDRRYFPHLADELEKNIELSRVADSFIYWYTLENQIGTTFSDKKLSNYRFRDYTRQQLRMVKFMESQIAFLRNADKYFTSKTVKDIIRARRISNTILLNSYNGIYEKVTLKDIMWLLRQSYIEARTSKFITYILTLPIWRNTGLKVIYKFRSRKTGGPT